MDSRATSGTTADAERTMDLTSWHARLAQHFSQLREVRHATWGDRPIFALEHGLEADEVKAVAAAVRAHIAHSAPSISHSLAWIVYAAEIGYGFSGDEYWQTFEEQTPGWTFRGDRYWIRHCYQVFERNYGGARPSGAWAEHFSIICWPITHAILPRDLQYQLARILYEVRDSFSADLFESPPKLGEFIAARSWNGNSRFQNFAQETQLIGQIAAALLLQGQLGTSSLIHGAALQRIGTDLDCERRAREWLRRARHSAQERAKIRGISTGRIELSSSVRRPDQARTEIAALGIEPRLVLRPRDPSRLSWDVSLDIPDLSHLLVRFPQTRDILTGSRCTVAGASGRPLARGRCLYGVQRVLLVRWPRAEEVLLQFEKTALELEYLLRTECLLRPGPSWLFRIASDGLAYELRSLRVRPGERYILVSATGPFRATEHLRPVELQCEGVHGALITLPAALTSQWEAELGRLGLGQARKIEVWPAGIGAVVWDGEGHGEWLASETPCLAICADHELSALMVSLGQDCFESNNIAAGQIVFVELPQLHVGLHTIRIHTRSGPRGTPWSMGDLDVVMRIREARPWSPGVSCHGPLNAHVDPPAPTLEQLWEGRVEISVRGPPGRHLKCAVSLRDTQSGAATFTKHLPSVALPVTPGIWKRHFERHFQNACEAPLAYETARVCEIEFTCDELGALNLRSEREFTPLRWAVRRDSQRHIAHLLDDSGDATPPQVVRMAFELPMVEEPLDLAQVYDVPTAGGLYVARRGASSAAVIVPPTVRSFADLRCVPHIDARERSIDAVLRVVSLACTWGSARLAGDLFSATRQRDVLRALAAHIFRLIGGDTWASAELSSGSGPHGLTDLKRAISKRREQVGIGPVFVIDCAALSAATYEERVRRVASFARRLRLQPPPLRPAIPRHGAIIRRGRPARERETMWLSELALRLASNPAVVEEWAGERLRAGTARLLEVSTLARAARFLVIATDRHLQSRAAPGEVYASWGWT